MEGALAGARVEEKNERRGEGVELFSNCSEYCLSRKPEDIETAALLKGSVSVNNGNLIRARFSSVLASGWNRKDMEISLGRALEGQLRELCKRLLLRC